MANELSVANAFFSQVLKGDATLLAAVGGRIYPSFVPNPTANAYPNITYAFISGINTMAMGGRRILSNPLYLLKVIGKGGFGDIGSIADQADNLLHGAQVSVTVRGVTFAVSCLQERPFERADWSDNEQFAERGGYYRCFIEIPAG